MTPTEMTPTEMTPTEMTPTDWEWAEMLDLYVADELPEALRASVGRRLASDPDSARDAATLRAALDRLRAAPAERPDAWLTERLLDALLREHAAEEAHSVNE